MKISLVKVSIIVIFYVDLTFSENIEIIRDFLDNKRGNWAKSKDSFNIPQSVCVNDSRYRDYCTDNLVCNTDGTNDGSHFPCECPDSNATLTYQNNQWKCLENKQVRKHLGCKINNLLFSGEKQSDKLRMLAIRTPKRRTTLARKDCAINLSSSWYTGCNGTRVPLKENTETLRLRWDKTPKPAACFLKVLNVSLINLFIGRVINLGIKWDGSPTKEGCLLFKVKGNIKCTVDKPPVRGLSSSMIPTSSSSFTKATTSPHFEPSVSPVRGFSLSIFPTTSSSFIMVTASPHFEPSVPPVREFSSSIVPTTSRHFEPSEALSRPSSGKKQKHDAVSSSSPIVVIVGVTVSIATVFLLIAVLVFYRRHKSRKDALRSTTGPIKKITMERSPHTNAAFELETENGYVITSNSRETRTSHSGDLYASLDVPEGHNIYGPGNTDEPFYNVLQEPSLDNEEDGQRYGSLGLNAAVYHALEDLPGEYPGNAVNNGPTRTEPVYNVLEEPFPGSSKRSECYGTLTVNEPFYNTLEQSQSNDDSQRTGDEPVYNTLEDPYNNGAGDDENYGSMDLQDPVYNVLEGPGTDEMEVHISDDKNIPVYAVANIKKK